MKKGMQFVIFVFLIASIMISTAIASSDGPENLSYDEVLPRFGDGFISDESLKKENGSASSGVNNNKSIGGGYKMSTCLVTAGGTAVTYEYEISSGNRTTLGYKSGYGAKGSAYHLYMRTSHFAPVTVAVRGSWSVDDKNNFDPDA